LPCDETNAGASLHPSNAPASQHIKARIQIEIATHQLASTSPLDFKFQIEIK
jgi:hypothetical protein